MYIYIYICILSLARGFHPRGRSEFEMREHKATKGAKVAICCVTSACGNFSLTMSNIVRRGRTQ